jgi:threonylcarbamoyladenosine tRNA methylthiotransferase MtaB
MVDFLAESRVFCDYLHIPLQSGDDQILKLMRRRYSTHQFRALVEELKEKIPTICIGTDVMVGFPYEDEGRFEASFRLVEASPLDYLHVFPYSPKKKTRAASFLGQVPTSEKKERVRRLTELSREKKRRFYQNAIGSLSEIIVEETHCEEWPGFMKGISRNYIPVYLSNSGGQERRKDFLSCRLSRYDGGHVFGEVI